MTGPLANWPVQDFLKRTGARVPIIQAPMAGAGGVALAAAAIRGGAVGSLPCAMLTADQVREQVAQVRAQSDGPLNLNFFCHHLGDPPDETAWRALLQPFYDKEGVGPPETPPPLRTPFDAAMCAAVEEMRPEIVSFHFGLPDPALLDRIRRSGAIVLGNATTFAEARWLMGKVDMVIAQGFEAGGHAGHFLAGHRPVGTMALTRQIVREYDAILEPVIAAGGIGDAVGIAAALQLDAGAVQLGTAYLHSAEATISAAHRAALGEESVVTNLFSGGLARGIRNALIDAIGPVHPAAPRFPYASAALTELRRVAEADGRGDYSPLWAGQAAALGRPARGEPPEGAQALTERLASEAFALLGETP
ncbi:nitronate monooxygenase [Sphingomonas suaedae]|uniref:Propionate 3-nitronate monooxygenase n=1 Tax=Sphingomonas suaedae TaxID=2599297 RepID=A0A518RGC7_9SPHN|nr:nitronate monooxygenase family protein [Sphingomonas suaedae]QDX26491.1 nitronate monooxygenase [Sphingomonas suaedae]